MQQARPIMHRDSILWHTVHNYASWHIWKARCAAEFSCTEITPHIAALSALLDVRRAAVNQIIELHHWDRWWALRPELNILDKESLFSDISWFRRWNVCVY